MIRTLLRIAVALIAFAWLSFRVDLASVGRALAAIAPSAVVFATAASFVANGVISYRLAVLLRAQGVHARTLQTFAINLTAFFYNLFLPVGGVGVAALRLQRLSTRSGGGFTVALTAMVCDRLSAVAALGLGGLACWLIDPRPKPSWTALVLLAGAAAAGVLAAPRAVPVGIRGFVRELHLEGSGTWWSAALRRLSDALGSVARLRPTALLRILGVSLLAQIPGTLTFWILARGLGLPLSFVEIGWMRGVVVLFTLLPISIGGVGVREGMLVLVLGAAGVPAHDALALSILVFATTILLPGLAGGGVEAMAWLRGERSVRPHPSGR